MEIFESSATSASRAEAGTALNATNSLTNIIWSWEQGTSIFPVSGDRLAEARAAL